MIAVAVHLAVVSSMLVAPEVSRFPGNFFDAVARSSLQSRVMETWPGPGGLLELWGRDDLEVEQRVAILLGGAAFHDPSLLPIYREAIVSPTYRIRQAAAYGYHDLIGDQLTDVTQGVGIRAGEKLGREMLAIERTLTRQTLIDLWLQGLLRNERSALPSFFGVAPRRSTMTCLMAIDRIVTIDDLDRLVEAYQLSEDRGNRIALMRLIEGLTLSRFVPRSATSQRTWGPEVYDRAFASLDNAIEGWPRIGCAIDADGVLIASLEATGIKVEDPRCAASCQIWQWVLRGGDPGWWRLAARQLYVCGGPWREISVLRAGGKEARDQRRSLLKWYLLTAEDLVRRSPTPAP